MSERLIRSREVRELLGISSAAVRAAVGRGELRRYGAPWGWGYDRGEVEALARKRQGADDAGLQPPAPERTVPRNGQRSDDQNARGEL